MFLEILPRQFGKTTRLIETAIDWLELDEKNIITIISHKLAWSTEIKTRIQKESNKKFTDRILVKSEMINVHNTHHKYFIDEFDLIKDNKLFIDDRGYYTSTLDSEIGSAFTRKICSYYYHINDPVDEKKAIEIRKLLNNAK